MLYPDIELRLKKHDPGLTVCRYSRCHVNFAFMTILRVHYKKRVRNNKRAPCLRHTCLPLCQHGLHLHLSSVCILSLLGCCPPFEDASCSLFELSCSGKKKSFEGFASCKKYHLEKGLPFCGMSLTVILLLSLISNLCERCGLLIACSKGLLFCLPSIIQSTGLLLQV